jgi:hypothetical protein
MCVYVSRAKSRLLVPFEVPELTLDKAIDRGWVRRDDGRLMEPKPPESLKTSPLWSQAVSNWFYGEVVNRPFDFVAWPV